MKYLVIVVVSMCAMSQAQLSDDQKAKIMEIHKACVVESKVPEELIAKAKTGEYVDDPRVKEQLFCFAKKAGFQSEDGELKMDVIKAKMNAILKDEKKTEEIMSKCAVKKATPQDTAFESTKCFHQYAPDKNVMS